MQPETRYVRSGDVSIADQVVGEGVPDLVLIPPFVSNVELAWENPRGADYRRRLASPPSTARSARSGARAASRRPSARWASRYARASTPASAS